MRFTHIIVATIAVAITTPIVAAPALTNYYIVQDNVTKSRCNVVDIKPTADGVTAGLVFDSRALAEAALAEAAKYEIPDCSINR
jgi:hypothetical protein